MRTSALIAAASVGVGGWIAATEVRKRDDVKLAQAAYDYGKWVGGVIGRCAAIREVAAANPDSQWTHDPETQAALAACERAEAKHGEGTVETIKRPA